MTSMLRIGDFVLRVVGPHVLLRLLVLVLLATILLLLGLALIEKLL